MPPTTAKIAIIGAGSVGSAIAFSLLLRRSAASVLLVDIDTKLRDAQVADLSDAAFLSSTRILPGSHADAGQCDIIVVSAGAKQHPGDTRLDLIDKNLKMLGSVLGAMKPIREDAVLLLVANPVDVLTYFAQGMSGLPKGQVFGSGTFLDSARLRGLLAKRLSVADTAIHANVLGEHGDSQYVAWSSASVAGSPLNASLPLSPDERKAIAQRTQEKAYTIIEGKGFTSYGIAAVTSLICEAIIFDQRQVYLLSHWQEDLGCCLSSPAVLGREGVLTSVKVPLDGEEEKEMEKSAERMRAVIRQCEDRLES